MNYVCELKSLARKLSHDVIIDIFVNTLFSVTNCSQLCICHFIFSTTDLEEGFHFDPKAEHGTQVYESQAVTLRDSSKLVKHVKASQHFQTYAKNLLVCSIHCMPSTNDSSV